jgi:methylase of polypeptide subunit release factors
LAKLDFSYPESKEVWKELEAASIRSHHNTRQAFEDFLTMTTCALAGGTMEAEYLETVERYKEGEKGKRACDHLARAFAVLIDAMEKTRKDILGDLFMGGVTFGENGQFYTPESICQMMAQMTMDPDVSGKTISDPCCGSGRMLLAASDVAPRNEFVGQDVDLRCVRMTAINLALRNLYGWVIWGNSLAREQRRVFRTGFNGHGFISEVEPEKCPEPVQKIIERDESAGPLKQLALF